MPAPIANKDGSLNHDAITEALGGKDGYGKGVTPNPYAPLCKEWERRLIMSEKIAEITVKIESLMEPRFITPPETSQFIEALITMVDAKKVLEIGMHTGFGALHILRALIGKGGHLVSIDPNPAFDREFFESLSQNFSFVEGRTPEAFKHHYVHINAPYDVVFVDSDHTFETTFQELSGILSITRPGAVVVIHDLPEWSSPTNKEKPAVRKFIEDLTKHSDLWDGCILPTARQLDCEAIFGIDYPNELSPHLGIMVRR